jgi:hypothetical protein
MMGIRYLGVDLGPGESLAIERAEQPRRRLAPERHQYTR